MDINQSAKRIVDLSTQEHNRKAKRLIDEATGDRSPLMDMLDVEPPPAQGQPSEPEDTPDTAEAKPRSTASAPRKVRNRRAAG